MHAKCYLPLGANQTRNVEGTCISIKVEARSSIIVITRCFIPHKSRLCSRTILLDCNLPTSLLLPTDRLFFIWVIFLRCPANSVILKDEKIKFEELKYHI
jgi:hypothetical protein